MQEIEVYLSQAQLRKLQTGQTFQLNKKQLSSSVGKHKVKIELSKSDYNKLLRNLKNDKGFRFTPSIIRGHGVKQEAENAVDKAREFLGIGVKQEAENAVDKAREFLGIGVKQEAENAVDKAREFLGIGVRKLTKGSPEMKAKMQKLRAMRKMKMGAGMWDWADPDKNGLNDSVNRTNDAADKALNPDRNGLNDSVARTNADADKALNPNKNGLSDLINAALPGAISMINNAFQPGQTAEQYGKQLASLLIHQGIPQATAYICGALATAACPEGGPVVGFVAGQAGKQLGILIANEIGKSTGYGLKKSRAVQGNYNKIKGSRFVKGVPQPIKKGGSFLPL